MLERLEASAAAAGRYGSLLEVQLLQTLTMYARGNAPAALEKLATAVAAAPEVDTFTRLFLDEQPALGELLTRAPRLAEPAHADALALLTRLLDAAGTPRVTRRRGPGVAGDLPDPLSDREMEVLRLLASELTGPEIARHLFISLNTLRTHTERIFTKLEATNRSAAVRRGRELNLL